jgi:glutathione S-transferase
MLELFQITGSASFAARAALEEAGVEYVTVNVHPRRRDEAPDFARVNPLRRVPALRDGEVTVYETGAVLLHVGDRFPGRALAPPPGDSQRAAYYRWMLWIADTLHPAWAPYTIPRSLTDDDDAVDGIRRRGAERLRQHGEYLERELRGRRFCLGEAFTLVDVYLYMIVGWRSYAPDVELGGPAVEAHYRRVGERPAIARTRELDDLDERLLRHHPELRAGVPI